MSFAVVGNRPLSNAGVEMGLDGHSARSLALRRSAHDSDGQCLRTAVLLDELVDAEPPGRKGPTIVMQVQPAWGQLVGTCSVGAGDGADRQMPPANAYGRHTAGVSSLSWARWPPPSCSPCRHTAGAGPRQSDHGAVCLQQPRAAGGGAPVEGAPHRAHRALAHRRSHVGSLVADGLCRAQPEPLLGLCVNARAADLGVGG